METDENKCFFEPTRDRIIRHALTTLCVHDSILRMLDWNLKRDKCIASEIEITTHNISERHHISYIVIRSNGARALKCPGERIPKVKCTALWPRECRVTCARDCCGLSLHSHELGICGRVILLTRGRWPNSCRIASGGCTCKSWQVNDFLLFYFRLGQPLSGRRGATEWLPCGRIVHRVTTVWTHCPPMATVWTHCPPSDYRVDALSTEWLPCGRIVHRVTTVWTHCPPSDYRVDALSTDGYRVDALSTEWLPCGRIVHRVTTVWTHCPPSDYRVDALSTDGHRVTTECQWWRNSQFSQSLQQHVVFGELLQFVLQ